MSPPVKREEGDLPTEFSRIRLEEFKKKDQESRDMMMDLKRKTVDFKNMKKKNIEEEIKRIQTLVDYQMITFNSVNDDRK